MTEIPGVRETGRPEHGGSVSPPLNPPGFFSVNYT